MPNSTPEKGRQIKLGINSSLPGYSAKFVADEIS
jgi:hypothetical protein